MSSEPVAALQPGTAAREPAWDVRLLGGVEARRAGRRVADFGGRSVVLLLARLALHPQRSHAREELVELLWPGVALDTGRNRLRQTLFALRQLLEPPGTPPGSVLQADRFGLRVADGAIDCDVARFEAALRESRFADAAALYAGELMPGHYGDWVHDERLRLAGLHDRVRQALDAAPPPTARPRLQVPGPAPDQPDLARNRLPIYPTRFFGRDAEAARLRSDVLAQRIVTLLGPGGAGKTRLAVVVAAALRDAPDRPFDLVAFVPLAGCGTRLQALDALAAALRLRGPAGDPVEHLADALSGRRVLLVLDNFEQLCGVADDVIAGLSAAVDGLHLLVTSRRALGLDGEREFALAPLATPPRDLALGAAVLHPAIALFIDRAQAVRADFRASPANLAVLIELAHLLEGMPLAVELAAARVRSIAPATLAELLRAARAAPDGRSLELLDRRGPRAGADPRHASMMAVVDWSWRLLSPTQAQLLAALTVFHGGFTAAAAQAVCGEPGGDPGAVHVGIDDLVAQSLLRAGRADAEEEGGWRFDHFEPVREFAARRLAPAAARAGRARHRAWLLAWTTALPPTPPLAGLRAEMDNLTAALASALADDVPEEAVRLALPLRRAFEDVELPAAGLALLEQAVDRCTHPDLRSGGNALLGPLLFNAGERDRALARAQTGVDLAQPGSPWRGRALAAAARVAWRIHRSAQGLDAPIDEATRIAAATGDTELQADLLALRAAIANHAGDSATGEARYREALTLLQALGNRHAINGALYNLAASAQTAGRHAEALERLAALEVQTRALHDWRRLSQALNVRGNALSELRRWHEAVAAFRDCIRLAWGCMALHELAYGLWNLPRALAHVREPERAVELAAFVAHFWQTRFGALTAADRHDLRRLRRLALCRIDPGVHDALWARGQRLPLAQAVALALGG